MALVIKDSEFYGEINAVAPECPSYSTFARMIGQLLQRPVFIRIPEQPLRLMLGEMASMFVDGPEIIPQRLLQNNFEYRFPSLRSALMDLT